MFLDWGFVGAFVKNFSDEPELVELVQSISLQLKSYALSEDFSFEVILLFL